MGRGIAQCAPAVIQACHRLARHRPRISAQSEVAKLADIAGLHNGADELQIPRLVALLARPSGLITVDSGPAHAAAAVGCPQVVLFGRACLRYTGRGDGGADVVCFAGNGWRERHARHRYRRGDRGLEPVEAAGRRLRRRAGAAGGTGDRSMSCVTNTTPRLVTKKRWASSVRSCPICIPSGITQPSSRIQR